MDAPANESRLLSLPVELRVMIWDELVSDDLHVISATNSWPLHDYTSPALHLSIFSLLYVSRLVQAEAVSVFDERCGIFKIRFIQVLVRMLGYRWLNEREIRGPRTLLRFLDISLFYRRIDAKGLAWGQTEHSIRPALYCSAAHPNEWFGLTFLNAVLNPLVDKRVEVRSLVIAAAQVLNVSVVRRLRRLRGITVHFAFIPDAEAAGLEVLYSEKQTGSDSDQEMAGILETYFSLTQRNTREAMKFYRVTQGLPLPNWKWLGENADTDLVLPVYESSQATVPIALAPLSRFADAIRREAASREPDPISVSQMMKDPPLWIDFDPSNPAQGDFPGPVSGWYRYVARCPGLCCLEQTTGPTPTLPQTRKNRRRSRREMGQLKRENLSCAACHIKSDTIPNLRRGFFRPRHDAACIGHVERQKEIRRRNINGIVFKP